MGHRLPDRVSVFIDYENAIRVARHVFAHEVTSRIDPYKLSRWLAGPERDLNGVHIYRGEPDAQRSPSAWAEFDRDVKRWVAMGAYVTTIPVQYGRNGIAREKGIDVALAIDVITRAVHQEFEVAVIVSNDRDLSPVVKALAQGTFGVHVEIASWVSGGGSDEVALHAPRVRNHRMDHAIYEHVADSLLCAHGPCHPRRRDR